jgi:hypothetical protein
VALALLLVPPAAADTLHVTNGSNAGGGSLRKAVNDAQPGDLVVIDPGVAQIVLSNDIVVGTSLTIAGQGAALTEVAATGVTRLFSVTSAVAVRIEKLKIAGGRAPSGVIGASEQMGPMPFDPPFPAGPGGPGGDGGAIFNSGGPVELTQVTLSGNGAGLGGGGGSAGTFGGFSPAGNGGDGGDGGAIFNSGTMTITGSTLSGNFAGTGGPGGSNANPGMPSGQNGAAGGGGAIVNTGTMTIVDSTLSGNKAALGNIGASGATAIGGPGSSGGSGGAILNSGALTLTGSALTGNEAGAGGAGGSATASTSGPGGTGGSGGAVFNTGTLFATNDTFSANAAGKGGQGGGFTPIGLGVTGGSGGSGGALAVGSGGKATLAASTLATNTAGAGGAGGVGTPTGPTGGTGSGGALSNGGSLTVRGSLLASNIGTGICPGGPVDGGGNLAFPDAEGCTGFTIGDPKLDPAGPASNGGPTQTIALLEGSAATDLVPSSSCTNANGVALSTDQRGEPRPLGNACDAGAFESGDRVVVPVVPTNKTDAGPPVARLVKQPKKTVKTKKKRATLTFAFTATPSAASFECKLDKGDFKPCTSPKAYKAKPGRHTFSVRALDSTGTGPAATATVKVKKIKKQRRKR